MILAGTSFSLHFKFLKGKFDCYRKNHEFNFFMLLIGGGLLVIGSNTFLHHFPRLETAFRTTLFQVVSILTTTGFGTADYEQWSATSQFILFLFMFIGGCAGSTGGGMKVIRLMILLQFVRAEVKRLLHPNAVIPVRIGDTVISRNIVTNILGFQALMLGLFVLGVIMMSIVGLDLVSSFGAVAATLGNIGPGLGSVGPTDHYLHVPVLGKWILSFFMLAGRLEIYTVLILFAPAFWKK